jgi:huntingtin-interacting protein 1-related protein
MTQSECIVYTWDYHSSISFWNGLRVQPILADEVQTFKALITVHKVLQEGHPVVCYTRKVVNYRLTFDHQTLKESHGQTAWLETCARTVGSDGQKGMCWLVLI